MRIFYLFLLVFCAALTAEAADMKWFVSVYGENFQHVTGASATTNIKDGEFLDVGFVGKEMYVRSEKHYELDQFRPSTSTDNSDVEATEESEAIAVARKVPKKPALTSEFGPLADTGLQFAINGDFHGWSCSQLYVKPLGGKTYRLRCETDMKYE